MRELPKIEFRGRTFTFDERLSQLRELENGIKFINLNSDETELLGFAIGKKDKDLISTNMEEIVESRELSEESIEKRRAIDVCSAVGGRFDFDDELCKLSKNQLLGPARANVENNIWNVGVSHGFHVLKGRLKNEDFEAERIAEAIGAEEAGIRFAMLKEDKKLIDTINDWKKKEEKIFKEIEED